MAKAPPIKSDDYLDIRAQLRDADPETVRWYLEQLPRTMAGLANEDWHGTGTRYGTTDREVIPADCWRFLRYDPLTRSVRGGGIEYIAVDFRSGPPRDETPDEAPDATLRRLRLECERYIEHFGQPPSQRKLSEITGINRKAIAARKERLPLKVRSREKKMVP